MLMVGPQPHCRGRRWQPSLVHATQRGHLLLLLLLLVVVLMVLPPRCKSQWICWQGPPAACHS
jgi:hypothetical protein